MRTARVVPMHRIFGIAVTAVWLTAMGALFVRDIWPVWTAQDPPPFIGRERNSQCGIYDAHGNRVGTAWSQIWTSNDQARHESVVKLDRLAKLPPVQIETAVTFTKDGTVDNFETRVYGMPMKIRIYGEAYGAYIPCMLEVGPFKRSFRLDAASSRSIAESIRSFDSLPELRVGQSWRMQVIDPVSAILNQQTRVSSVVARVEREETIVHEGRPVRCFVVTAARTKAWVSADGTVLRQESDVPGLGRLILEDEEFREDMYHRAKGDDRPRSPKQ